MKFRIFSFILLLAKLSFSQVCLDRYATEYGAGNIPRQIISDDFNNDGKRDLAIANQAGNTVSVLMGTGATTSLSANSFGQNTDFVVGTFPYSVTSGDFNGDGNVDLACANNNQKDVSVLLGDGTGNFTLIPQTFSVGNSPVYITCGELNGDSKLDLAIANFGEQFISVLFGLGNGFFDSAINVPVGGASTSIVLSDFNNDAIADLAVSTCYPAYVSILLGSNTGSFLPDTSYSVGGYPNSIVSADFNNDLKPDIATATYSGNQIAVLLGTSAGKFVPMSPISIASPFALTAADLDKDGSCDLASANYFDFGNVRLFKGQGNGNFLPFANTPSLQVSSSAVSIIADDFNNDSSPDIAVASNDASVFLSCLTTGLTNANMENISVALSNPNNGDLILTINSYQSAAMNIKLTNIWGQLLYSDNVSIVEGTNEYQRNLQYLSKGVYFLCMEIGGRVRIIKKLILH